MTSTRPILVTGFGPFPGFPANASGALARAVDGRSVGGVPIAGIEVPSLWETASSLVVAKAREIDARWVLGVGIGRDRIAVETVGWRESDGNPDFSGRRYQFPAIGPDRAEATIAVDRLAAALGGEVSQDAGRYLCNAWLYGVASELTDRPVGFVHVPTAGIPVERLIAGLRALLPDGRPPT